MYNQFKLLESMELCNWIDISGRGLFLTNVRTGMASNRGYS